MIKPNENDTELRFENNILKAEITVEDRKLTKPVPNPQEKLAQLALSAENVFSQRGKVLLSEHVVEARPGAECLYERIIVTPRELPSTGGIPATMAMHVLECLYGPDHSWDAQFMYTYPTQGRSDPQQKQIKEFFAGIDFKVPAAEKL